MTEESLIFLVCSVIGAAASLTVLWDWFFNEIEKPIDGFESSRSAISLHSLDTVLSEMAPAPMAYANA